MCLCCRDLSVHHVTECFKCQSPLRQRWEILPDLVAPSAAHLPLCVTLEHGRMVGQEEKTQCVFGAISSVNPFLSPGGVRTAETASWCFVTYMWSWWRARDWGHDWAAGGLSVDKNERPLPL